MQIGNTNKYRIQNSNTLFAFVLTNFPFRILTIKLIIAMIPPKFPLYANRNIDKTSKKSAI